MTLLVEQVDGLVTVQDRGRVGYADLGVPRGGALDQPAAELANRLVGNTDDADGRGSAVLELTLARLALRSDRAVTVAVTGAQVTLVADGRERPFGEPVTLAAGGLLTVEPAREGVRSYLAVAGGIAVPPVLGSRSTDTLAWVGPAVVRAGSRLPVGRPAGAPRPTDVRRSVPAPDRLRLLPGPRLDWFAASTLERLTAAPYTVHPDSDRVGLRLLGPALTRVVAHELPSEGMVLGAVQVPPDGQPVVLLNDHPVTGGYPVVALVDRQDLSHCAQLRPGETVRFSVPAAPAR